VVNEQGDVSALVGWAVDGSPLLAPYDPETGRLQVSVCIESSKR
jgi:hypothetical protein